MKKNYFGTIIILLLLLIIIVMTFLMVELCKENAKIRENYEILSTKKEGLYSAISVKLQGEDTEEISIEGEDEEEDGELDEEIKKSDI